MFCKVFSHTRFAQATMLTRRLSAKFSTSVLPRRPSTASSAPMEPSSTRSTSSATGGSTLTAPSLLPSLRRRTASWQQQGKQRVQRLLLLMSLMPTLLPRVVTWLLRPRTRGQAWKDTRPSIPGGEHSSSGNKAGGHFGSLALPVTYHQLWHYLIKLTAPYMLCLKFVIN